MGMVFSQLPELRHLRCFLTVVEERSFSRAAEKLRVSQQQVSRTIQALEELVGASLLERTTRQVRLSPTGEFFFPAAVESLEGMEKLLRRTRMRASGKMGRLTVAFSSFAMESTLPEVLQRYRLEHPSIGLELHEMGASQQEQALLANAIDAGFSISPCRSPELTSSVLMHSRFLIAVPVSSDWLGRCALSHFRSEPFLQLDKPSSPGYNETVERVYHEAGFMPRHLRQGQSLSALLSMVSSGAGVLLAPECILHQRRAGVRYLPVETEVCAELVCTTRRDSQSIALHALKKLAQESAAAPEGGSVDAAKRRA